MKTVHVKTRAAWRKWLAGHHDKEPRGIWLKFHRKASGKPTLDYGASVEEALCYGWIDSIIKKIDDESYCRKFTPRKPTSMWSAVNKKRVAKMIEEGRMTPHGQALIDAAKRSGSWKTADRLSIDFDIPEALAKALRKNTKAKRYFDSLAPSYQKQYIGWIITAKREETRDRRITESIRLLEQEKKLGLR